MTSSRRSPEPGPRRGLVLGAGGTLGYNWLVAALSTLSEESGLDPRQFDVVVGTSAGAIVAACIGSGLHPTALLRDLRGARDPDDPSVEWDHDRATGGALPPPPLPFLGSPTLAVRVLRRPRAYPPMVVMTAFAPRGRRPLQALEYAIGGLTHDREWPTRPRTWIVATDYSRGRRVVFGDADAPLSGLPAAVAASCAIPAWFAPVVIDNRRYVDGGVCSTTSADVLVREALDEVFVLMPLGLASGPELGPELGTESSAGSLHPLVYGERWVRRLSTRRTLREVAKLRAAGTAVTLLTPHAEVLAAMGWNVMDHRRRSRVLEVSLRTTADAWRRRDAKAA